MGVCLDHIYFRPKISAAYTALQLKELGMKPEDISLLAEKTLQDGSIGNSAVLPTVEQVEDIFTKAM